MEQMGTATGKKKYITIIIKYTKVLAYLAYYGVMVNDTKRPKELKSKQKNETNNKFATNISE